MARNNGKASTNGQKSGDGKVRVAIVGVGNCASSLVQGRYYYADAKDGDFVPGLMHVNLGGYHIRDIEFVAAFDIDRNKVGKDLSEAIYVEPNNTYRFADVPHLGVSVERGMTHDGLGKYLSEIIEKAPGPTADIVGILKERNVDVLLRGARADAHGAEDLPVHLDRDPAPEVDEATLGDQRQGQRVGGLDAAGGRADHARVVPAAGV